MLYSFDEANLAKKFASMFFYSRNLLEVDVIQVWQELLDVLQILLHCFLLYFVVYFHLTNHELTICLYGYIFGCYNSSQF